MDQLLFCAKLEINLVGPLVSIHKPKEKANPKKMEKNSSLFFLIKK